MVDAVPTPDKKPEELIAQALSRSEISPAMAAALSVVAGIELPAPCTCCDNHTKLAPSTNSTATGAT